VKLERVDLSVGGEREEANDEGDEGEQHGWSSKDEALFCCILWAGLLRPLAGNSGLRMIVFLQ